MYTFVGGYMNKKVIGVGMSGGVDSSAAAYLLKQQGYEVIGITMRLIDNEKTNDAINDAKTVCEFLGIEHRVVDLREEFKTIVIDNFIDSYRRGVTPNPCCVCNKHFKFGLFYDAAKKIGCDYISTGHYAKIVDGKLYRANVLEKDQSYFLWGINKEVLKYVVLPLQDYDNKDRVREMAGNAGISVSKKKDSQEVCFVPNDDYKAFLNSNLEVLPKSGDICLKDGTVLGKHNGLMYYTVGQRKGLNISYKEPLYVIKLDTDNNKLIVGSNDDLFGKELVAKNVNLLVDSIPEKMYAKVRSRGQLKPCVVEFLDNKKMKVTLLEEERAITLGQSVVLYDKENCCLGGGVIEEVL